MFARITCNLGRVVATTRAHSRVTKSFSKVTRNDLQEQERLVEEFYEMKQRDQHEKNRKQTSFKNRIISEKHLFTESQKVNVRKLVKAEFEKFLGRAKFMPVIDDTHLNTFAKALLSLESLEGIDSEHQLPGLLDLVFDKIHTVANFEPFINLVEVVFKHKVQISENSKYFIIASGTGWASRIEPRQQIAFLALFPPDQQPAYKELFQNYEAIFIEYFTRDIDKKTTADFMYLIEVLKVYRNVNYGMRRSQQKAQAS